jgi:hypothetical protein
MREMALIGWPVPSSVTLTNARQTFVVTGHAFFGDGRASWWP